MDTFKTVDLLGHKHTIRRCSIDDVDNHFNKVKHLIPEDEHKSYKLRMELCVSANYAFCLEDESCFLYMRKTSPCVADAFSFFGEGAPLKTLALLAGIFINIDKRLLRISFFPHTGKNIFHFKSIMPAAALMRKATPKHPAIFRADLFRAKILEMMERRGIKWEV